MPTQHTAKAFDTDLQDITRKVAEMGGLAEREVADSVQALSRRDSELARKVIATDATVDALQLEIEEKAILTIARRQPMAVDLREIVGALRVANDLERIGDLADRTRLGLASIPGVNVRDRGTRRTGIVTFTHDRVHAPALAATIQAAGVNVSLSTPDYARHDFDTQGVDGLVRVSPHAYNIQPELDQLLEISAAV